MFALKQKVVYPGHGVAEITKIVERRFNNVVMTYYELSFINKKATVLVPVQNTEHVGIRILSSECTVKAVFTSLTHPARRITIKEFLATTWNRRNKGYQAKLATGDLLALTEIYKDLRFLSQTKELSFGEKTILQQVELMISEEIALIKRISEDETRILLQQLSTYSDELLRQQGL